MSGRPEAAAAGRLLICMRNSVWVHFTRSSHMLDCPGSSYQAGIYNSAQYYNANNINPNQYALDLLGAINASGVPLIVEAPSQERQPRMWMGTTVPEVEDGGAFTIAYYSLY